MKERFLIGLFVLANFLCNSQGLENYHSLDATQPLVFGGSYIVYKGDTIQLGPKSFFIDRQLPDEVTKKYPYVFNSVNKAVLQLTDGSEASPMILYIAPYVYWIDDPDDPSVRVGENGQPPYGLVIKCEWLKFYGLSGNASNVVLACNRGQTIGAVGNFTMFRIIGQGTSSENITFGNYCNVDLTYPLLPKLDRKKRASAIVQAQLILCNGDKIFAENTRFISRLNLCPFVGGKRVLFNRCHFESTDDALCGTGVYLNCTLDIYSSKPFYSTSGTGAVFLNCAIKSYVQEQQYFTKANGQVAVIDTRFTTAPRVYLGWRDVVPFETRNYQLNVTQNDKLLFIGKQHPANTISLENKSLQHAYRFTSNGKLIYNTYNLLSGDDDWDPMHIKKIVQDKEKESHLNLSKIPIQLTITPARVSIETGRNDVTLTAKQLRFGNYEASGEKISWRVATGYDSLVKLEVSEDGLRCKVIPVSNFDDTKEVVIIASTAAGLEGANVITVAPPILPAPGFKVQPKITFAINGQLHLDYLLNTTFKDQSMVTWYRCSNAAGSDAIEVAVSRLNKPFIDYTLSPGDAGYYIMASIKPKHSRSDTGNVVHVVMQKPVAASDIKVNANTLVTDFKNISTRNQSRVLPGFWNWGHLIPMENERRQATDTTRDAWYYGTGSEGAADLMGIMQGRNGKMSYTPVHKKSVDMHLKITTAPFKTAGQGFSVAPLYMDILIKLDANTMTGYGVRLIRTTKYHDAVDVYFIQYDHGEVKTISDAVTTTAFRTSCIIELAVIGNVLSAKLNSTAGAHASDGKPGIQPVVNIQTNIQPNSFGGFGVEFKGGSPVLFSHLEANWK